ncbi:MAG: YkgJ family cysteine cluster protein [Nitrospirae bacterium]|nr:MAG: YkgJ family cysteine cluster protein [Nitrospirota bacterium]
MSETVDLDAGVYLDKLYEVYKEIDKAYADAADYYGFSCEGCEQNCCDTVFYHYTLIEFFGLMEGFEKLDDERKAESLRRAEEYLRKLNRFRGREYEVKILCPLNYDGLCAVYEHRPLICRVHGLPGAFKHPGKGTRSFPGCKRFEDINKKERKVVIDRTQFYSQIATLESQLRRQMDYMMKFQKTIAEMLLDRNLI